MRGALVGAAIAGFFGGAWALWGAGGLPGAAATAVRVMGVLVGAAVVVGSLVLARRAGGDGGPTMFSSRSYRLIVVAEVVALVVGNGLLNALGFAAYVVVWTSLVVGVHFLAFGRVFAPVFTAIGAAMVAAAVLGLVVGLVSGSAAAVLVVTALISAVVLLGSGAARVVLAARQGVG